MDFPITVDPDLDSPLWKQLWEQLRCAIESGRLVAGDEMPSTRELAKLLGLSRDTVVRAYDELIGQGYLQPTAGSGTFVSARVPSPVRAPQAAPPGVALKISDYARRIESLSITRATSADQPHLNYGAAPPDLLPARQWREILSKHCHLQEPHVLDYQPEIFGHLPLREAIASLLRRSKDVRCTSDQVAVFIDSQLGLDLLFRLLLNPGDLAVVEDPGYTGARENLLCHGVRLHPIPVDEDGLITERLADVPPDCRLVYITPSHHDPTGAVLSLERRRHLLAWARKRGVLIIEDAFDSDYRYGSKPMPSLQSLDGTGSVIYIYSFWKVLYPIATTSCLVLPPELATTFMHAKLLVERNSPITEHYALCDFITEGHLERHIRRTKTIYAKRRQSLIYALASNFKGRISYPRESAGLHLIVNLKSRLTDDDVVCLALECGLPMVSTAPYYVNEPRRGEFLIAFSALDEKTSSEAVALLAHMLSEPAS